MIHIIKSAYFGLCCLTKNAERNAAILSRSFLGHEDICRKRVSSTSCPSFFLLSLEKTAIGVSLSLRRGRKADTRRRAFVLPWQYLLAFRVPSSMSVASSRYPFSSYWLNAFLFSDKNLKHCQVSLLFVASFGMLPLNMVCCSALLSFYLLSIYFAVTMLSSCSWNNLEFVCVCLSVFSNLCPAGSHGACIVTTNTLMWDQARLRSLCFYFCSRLSGGTLPRHIVEQDSPPPEIYMIKEHKR